MIIVAPDKFKGSLAGSTIAGVIAKQLRENCPDEEVVELPIPDGGEGSVELALKAGYDEQHAVVTGPIGGQVHATYARRESKAVIETASAVGLTLLPLPPNKLTAATASTFGVGELIGHVIDSGVDSIVLGVGGTSTTDGGAGLASALGAHMASARGADLSPGASGLAEVSTVSFAPMLERLRGVKLVVASDVDNPLLGPDGSAMVFGRQKGADDATLAMMEQNLSIWATAIEEATGTDVRSAEGVGAGGGIAAPLVATGTARIVPGAQVMMDLSRFSTLVQDASVVVVGEGSLDAQSLHGKGPIRVAQCAKDNGAAVVAVVGKNELTEHQLAVSPIDRVYAMTDIQPDVAECIERPVPILETIASQLAADVAHRADW